jgi:hypothetical protein
MRPRNLFLAVACLGEGTRMASKKVRKGHRKQIFGQSPALLLMRLKQSDLFLCVFDKRTAAASR